MNSIQLLIEPRHRSIGFGSVDRLLPFRLQRMVGPFIYLDLMGPEQLGPGAGMDVPPHPHIGLATLTYLHDGSLMHRDSTGAVQRIDPGDVNWMHAGRGVVHSERSPDDQREGEARLAGAQFWVAAPDHAEDDDPFFEHHPVSTLPEVDAGDARARLLAGSAYDRTAPTTTASRLHLVALTFSGAGRAPLPREHTERAVVVLDGTVTVDDEPVEPRSLAVLDDPAAEIRASGAADVLLLGGEPVGDRSIWWNFVASSKTRIDEAKERWQADRFPRVEGETERVPLPSG